MNNFYCAAPWRGLHINPNGVVKTCCAGIPNAGDNLNSRSIEEILNGPALREIRESMSKGQPHAYCDNCVRTERFGADSERTWHNNNNPDFDFAQAGTDYHYPVIVDVRWNTTCNLSCNYCGEACSSKWAAIKNIPIKSDTRPRLYYTQVCDFILKHHDHIKEVALVGGEPLLLPENDRLLDVIPSDAIVTIITNLSVDLESNKIFKKLSARQKVGWSMSFDNIGQRFEYVRHGSKWELLVKNLSIVNDLKKSQGHWGGIHAVYNMYNATRICELREFAEQNNTTVLWQLLHRPGYLEPFSHGPRVAQLAIDEIEKFYSMGIATPAERAFFDPMVEEFRKIINENRFVENKFLEHITQIEQQYHPDQFGNFKKLWPELAWLVNSLE